MGNAWSTVFLGNSIRDWTIAISLVIIAAIVTRLLQTLIVNRIKKLALKSKTTIDDLIIALLQTSGMPLLYVYSVYAGFRYLNTSSQVQAVGNVAMLLVTTFFILRAITTIIKYAFAKAISRDSTDDQRLKQSKGILLIIQVIIWVCGILFLVDNLGYDITTVIAGLGIGGIAIALAAQTILGDLFGYLVIFFDKPFEVGDFIIIDDKMGVVEHIGIKTTRLRTLGGEQLVCSNEDLTKSRVHNYKRMQERRIVFSFGVTYNTPAHKLRNIPELVKTIVEKIEGTRFDRAHFKSYGSSSLDFEVVYFILTPDYNKYMDLQQAINLALFESFEKRKIEFAYPTQTVLLRTLNEEDIAVENGTH